MKQLAKAGHSVCVFDRNSPEQPFVYEGYSTIKWIKGDFENAAALREAMVDIDLVFHLISTTTPATSSNKSIPDISKNVLPSINLLELMRDCGLSRIIFISSGGTVYGPSKTIPMPEDHPTNPIVSHGIAKLTIEKYLLLYKHQYNLVPTIVRLTNPYGPTQIVKGGQGVVSSLLQAAINKTSFEIWGDGNVIRDYIFIDDVVDALLKSVSYSGKEPVLNLSSSIGVSVNELVGLTEAIVGASIIRDYKPGRTFDIDKNVLDNTLIKEELAWTQKTDLKDGLKTTYECMRKLYSR